MEIHPVTQFISWVPGLVLASFASFFLLLLAGWLWSVVAGFRSEAARRMRGYLIFPLTNPFALLAFLRKDGPAARPALYCYLLAFVLLWGGGELAERLELRKLSQYKEQLHQAGESLAVESLIPESVPVESNVWLHPFLQPLAVAGQNTEQGMEARQVKPYESLEVPSPDSRLEYPDQARSRGKPVRYPDPFQDLHESALAALARRNGQLLATNAPVSWAQCGRAVVDYFQEAEADFDQLREALARPFDQYPYSWQDGIGMLLPHLAQLKSFSRSASLRAAAWASIGEREKAFREARLGLRLVQAGHSDLVISRLVQIAQTLLALNTLRVAQQFHLWTDDQWRAIDMELARLDFPGLVPDALKGERIFASETIEPMLQLRPTAIVNHLDQLGSEAASGRAAGVGLLAVPVDTFLGGHGRANLARNWIGCLEAYEEFITGIEATLVETRTKPWKDCEPPALARGYHGYGILASMLLPALDKFFQKSINAQAQIALARLAVALERYYLRFSSYPESLAALAPEFYDGPLRDPMDHQPWRYSRDGQAAFRVYAVGENAVDDGGEYQHSARPSESRKDDILWVIRSQPPPLPKVEFKKTESSNSAARGLQMDPELMKRYGLTPEAAENGPAN